MGQAQEKQYLTSGEYFQIDEDSDGKYEYFHGEIFAMGGAAFTHNLIASNVFIATGNALKGRPCFILSSDMKIQTEEDLHYVYPDISVICGDIEFAKGREDIITNPVVIFEILSKSTKDYDMGTKFTGYRNLASFKDYILIDQYTCHVMHYHKNENKQWVLEEFKNLENSLRIRSIDIELELSVIYDRVRFKDPDKSTGI